MNNLATINTPKTQLCNTEKLIENFIFLISEMDFSQEIKILEIGTFNIKKRKLAYQNLLALTIVLWRLALQKSFPEDYEHIFERYLAKRRDQALNKKEQTKTLLFQLVVRSYVDLLETQGDRDFTEISSYLIKKLNISIKHYDSICLKLALSIRNIYSFLFQRLI